MGAGATQLTGLSFNGFSCSIWKQIIEVGLIPLLRTFNSLYPLSMFSFPRGNLLLLPLYSLRRFGWIPAAVAFCTLFSVDQWANRGKLKII